MKPEDRRELYTMLLNDIYELIHLYQAKEKELYDLAYEYECYLDGVKPVPKDKRQ